MNQDRLSEGHELIAAGRIDDAATIFMAVLEQDEGNLEAIFGLGEIAACLGQHDEATEIASYLTESSPDDPRFLRLHGDCFLRRGDRTSAEGFYREALSREPRDDFLRQRIIAAAMPGENYYDVMKRVHALLQPRTYIEIGVANGRSLVLAGEDCRVLGVDPEPVLESEPGPNTEIFAVPSDSFFADVDIQTALGASHFDLAFIDGLHTFEQALRDFINLMRYVGPNSVVLIHDCYPIDRLSSQPDRQTNIWSGDVWKVTVALRDALPEIRMASLKTPPTGLGIVRPDKGLYEILSPQYDAMVSKFKNLDYEWLGDEMDAKLGAVENDWQTVADFISS